ncbi:MAG: CHASE2 domain-containing protein [Methylophilus sp.]
MIIVLFTEFSPFKSARLAFFDELQVIYPRISKSQPVVIIDIDEATLGALGQWPWPRNYLSALLDAVTALKPSAIGIDIIMPESDHASPQAIAESRPDLPQDVLLTLTNAPSNDGLLAQSIAQAPTILGAAGFLYNTSTTLDGLRTQRVNTHGENPIPWLNSYPYVLASLPIFQAAAKGQGLLSNNPERGILRRATLLSNINGTVTPGLALEVIRVAHHAPHIIANTGTHGLESAEIAGKRFPLQSNGETWVYFDQPSSKRYISAISILKNEVPTDQVQGKMVLIGLTGLGLQDMITTPMGEQRSGVEVHAQIIENFADSMFVIRPWWMQWLEFGILLISGTLMIWLLPNAKIKNIFQNSLIKKTQPLETSSPVSLNTPSVTKEAASTFQERRKHLRYTSRIGPKVMSLMLIFLFIFLFSLSLILFYWSGILFDAVTLFIALATILSSLFFSAAMEYDKQRKNANHAFQNQRLKAAQITGELNAARRIQLGTLPDATNSFKGETRFKIEALLEPAREVGGDLYDFFMIDHSRLFFIIGDVAGKGLPACLFMVVTKALAKSAALDGGENIGAIISKTSMEMARENPEMLFVTGIAGILDLESGFLELVNAGHDAPWLMNNQGEIKRIEGSGGPPLGIMDSFEYPYQTIQLAPGDTLLCVTDGVYEAMNATEDLYGTDRVAKVLERTTSHGNLGFLTKRLRDDLRRFVGETEPSDDITLLLLHWVGKSDSIH